MKPWQDRAKRRVEWFGRALNMCAGCDLVFVDPDNGLEPSWYAAGRANAAKSVSIIELQHLARPDRTVVAYHHQTRFRGGHLKEIASWSDRLRESGFSSVSAIRAGSSSPRVYFLLNADHETRLRATKLCLRWTAYLTWHAAPQPNVAVTW